MKRITKRNQAESVKPKMPEPKEEPARLDPKNALIERLRYALELS